MKRKGIISVLLILPTSLWLFSIAFAYTLNGNRWSAGQGTIYSTGGSSNVVFDDAFVKAMNNWNNLSKFTFSNASGYSDPCDDPNVYGSYSGWKFDYSICGESFGEGTLAVNWSWTKSDGTIVKNCTVFNAYVTWDIHNGPSLATDFKRVATHELGHGLGLSHESLNTALMNPYYSDYIETPQTDDINGLRAIYGGCSTGTVPVYRFWSDTFGHHFFTSNIDEKNHLISYDPNWSYEGVAWHVYPTQRSNTVPVYRFWSDTFSGHVFTANEEEKNNIISNDPNWSYEGVAWYAYSNEQPNTLAVHRFWSETFKGFFYTTNESENDHLICCDPKWNYQGIAYYASTIEETSTIQNDETSLLIGSWHFWYTIITQWHDYYYLNTISNNTNSQGARYVFGVNQYNNVVIACYWPNDGYWALLDSGYIIDLFYVFYTDGNRILNNSCYYQISKSTGKWSRCYNLNGVKFSSLGIQSFSINMDAQKDGRIAEKIEQDKIYEIVTLEEHNKGLQKNAEPEVFDDFILETYYELVQLIDSLI